MTGATAQAMEAVMEAGAVVTRGAMVEAMVVEEAAAMAAEDSP